MKPTKLICPVCNKKYEIYTVYEVIDEKCLECKQNEIKKEREKK